MAELRLEGVTKKFGEVVAVNDLNLTIHDGEFFVILGPPGAGKTTTLRLIVGLARPDAGEVFIDNQLANDIYPGERDISMIFQNLALYPNKTVYENIAFPLREHKVPKDEIDAAVRAAADVLHITRLLDRKPGKLSGGERQRVAIGRAIVRRPKAYLMDEPLANLDAKLRLEMRVELKRLQLEMGQTLVYVTHDQIEALSMADRIGVLNQGVLQQVDVPDIIYRYPNNSFVATVVGSPPMNFLDCDIVRSNGNVQLVHPGFSFTSSEGESSLVKAIDIHKGDVAKALLGVRPEDIGVHLEKPNETAFPAIVSVVEPLGEETILDLELGDDIIKATIPPTEHVSENQPVFLTFNGGKLHLFDSASQVRFYSSDPTSPLTALSA
ncbi:MAG: ABC transporter ATP-binding protein [Caldilineales bacterium]|nr:ABC transporter ATP-binding protein [Caldilineales bacterium]